MACFQSGILANFLFFYLLGPSRCLSEQHCSKFPYEEALLEKMVRMEFNFEKLKEDIRKEIDHLQKDRLDFDAERSKEEIRKEQEIIHEDMEKTRNIMKTAASDIQAKFYSDILQELLKIRQEQEKQRNFFDTIAEDTKNAPDISFRVKGVEDTSPADQQIIVFKSLMENPASAYDGSNGIFTAPTGGLYFFSVQFCGTRDKEGETNNLYFAFVIDHVRRKATSAFFAYYTCSTSTMIVRLNQGARVWIESTWSHPKEVLKSNKYMTNEFSGMLVTRAVR